jgi:protoporphyrinogen oxidase
MTRTAIIIGAGPAGLTAAYELVQKTNIKPIILEKSGDIGGLSKTVKYKGNRMDIGGHRFFSKSDKILEWWLNILPLEAEIENIQLAYQNKVHKINSDLLKNGNSDNEKKMLLRSRRSRIYYQKKFFSYPVTLSIDTVKKLGVIKISGILVSYLYSKLFPIRNEKTLEDFFINRFERNLYKTFFKDYTEKVWGKSCNEISAEWGKQRIKGLSIKKTISHALTSMRRKKNNSIKQKSFETSLIERFLYPKLGPGQLWEEVAKIIIEKGGEIHFNMDVMEIHHEKNIIKAIRSKNRLDGNLMSFMGDFYFSTMPVKEFVVGMFPFPPDEIMEIANGLEYRDFITIGLLVKHLKPNKEHNSNSLMEDNWIYIQEKGVKIGRLQIFNNWSPFMVNDQNTVWLGLEYFCTKGDELWMLDDAQLQELGINELCQIGLTDKSDFIDAKVVRVEKAYPAYFGTYQNFPDVKNYLNKFSNLFLVGRNGMHKYNNTDHSMLTAIRAVENIMNNETTKENIWEVNTEDEYNE